jgi:hypothetical protein
VIQRILSGMAERRMPEIMGERNRFNEIFVKLQAARDRTRDLRDLETVRQARAKQVTLVIDEDLGFVFETAEGGRMNDAIPVALKLRAADRRSFTFAPSARVLRADRVDGEIIHG